MEARDALQRQVPAPPEAKILQTMQELLGAQRHMPRPNLPTSASRDYHLPALRQDHPFTLQAKTCKGPAVIMLINDELEE